MKKTLSTQRKIDPLSLTLASGLMVAVLVMPLTSYAAPKDKTAQRGNAYGHFIAPGHIKNFGQVEKEVDWLPPGIAKKVDLTDPELPELDDFTVELISTSSATIAIASSEAVAATVYLSTDAEFDKNTAEITRSSTDLMSEHTIEITELTPGTEYFYLIELTDEDGNTTITDEMSFETNTEPAEDTVAPIISGLTTEHTDTTITVDWMTDEDADSTVYLSTLDPIDIDDVATIAIGSDELTTTHSLTATDLMPDTTYYGVVVSKDEFGNESISTEFTVTTAEAVDAVGPILTNILVDATATDATITWDSNEESTSVVYFDTVDDFNLDASTTAEVSDDALVTSHSLTLEDLTPNTTYYFAVASVDENDNYTLSSIASFTTPTVVTDETDSE